MKLTAPMPAPVQNFTGIDGRTITLGDGKRTLICFFRDPACPFCNFRIFELTYKHKELSALGLQVVALFPAKAEALQKYAASRPRPFIIVADDQSEIYENFGVNHFSAWGKYKGILTRIPTLLKGLKLVGFPGLFTTNLMPADFLVNEKGEVEETWYGTDAGDRIPFERIKLFLAHGMMNRVREAPSFID